MAAQATLTAMDRLVSGQPAIVVYFAAFYAFVAAIVGCFIAVAILITGRVTRALHTLKVFVVAGAALGVVLKIGDTLRNR